MGKAPLTPDQDRALREIVAAYGPGECHLLTGYAGTGKTYLMQVVARRFQAMGLDIALTAPTHKAVAVLAAKIQEAGIENVTCRTIFSLLGLKPKVVADRQVFERDRRAEPVTAHVVIVDECSMVSADLLAHIRRYLPLAFVLFVGDPAQLPPVGEVASRTFETKSRSHLDTVVRQGAGNPILDVATALRSSQGGPMDWSWCRSAKAPPLGVYLPADAQPWMRKAFTSNEFADNPDAFRYLAWTNARVAEINRQVREWRYGPNLPTPFMVGERAMARGPVMIDGALRLTSNEEAEVLSIERGSFDHEFDDCEGAAGWVGTLPTWRIVLRKSDCDEITVHMPADDREFNRIVERVTDEAAQARQRWKHLHEFKGSLAKLQSIYALTVHNSQGSTFRNTFVDVPDIRRRAESNVLEAQQLLYVTATRPTHALILVGVGK